MNKITVAVIATLTALSSYAQAQAPASPAPTAPMAAPAPAAKAAAPAAKSASTDPIVASRMARRDADAAFSKAQAAARKERDDKVNAAVEAALKDPKNAAKDKQVLRREARAQARTATRADYDAAIKVARTERDAGRAAAQSLAQKK